MSRGLAALAIALTVLAAWFARSAQVAPFGYGPLGARAARPQPPASAPTVPEGPLARNPFRYVDEPAARAPSGPAVVRATPPPPPAAAPTPEPIRLTGFVRRGGELKAVLFVAGTTLVAAAGESAEGYRVLSVDEDAGVRVRGPAGEELLLRPAAR
jgi:hypothetical protein